jgi:glycosyltransferase involved in cell wall biosynthesis
VRRRYDYEVVIVDDNSPDGTQDVVKQLQCEFGDRIVRFSSLPILLIREKTPRHVNDSINLN